MPARIRPTDELVRRHQRGVWRHLRFLGAPPTLADDLTQETFLLLVDRPPADLGDDALAAWLRGTARNLFRRDGRTARRGVVLSDDAVLEHAWVELAGPDDGETRIAALRTCVETLAERERTALQMSYRERATHEDIGAALGLRPQGIKTLLRRIRDALRRCMRRRTGHE